MQNHNQAIVKATLSVIRSTKVKTFFLNFDCLEEEDLPKTLPKGCELIPICQYKPEHAKAWQAKDKKIINLPKIHLGRLGLIKMAMVFAISHQWISNGSRVVFLTGSSDDGILDTLLVSEVGKESEILTSKNFSNISENIQPEVFEHLLSLAVELASKGREGKPIGTIFVVGDQDRVMQLSKQMIINPFKGYEESERNILNPELKETIREFSSLDGAFVISDDGTVLTAGRYLGAAYDEDDVPRGLGSRHIAAAGITSLTNSVAIVISESTGDVRIFKGGKIIMEIEKP